MANEPSREWLSYGLEEYKVTRTAIFEVHKAAQATVTFGGATLGILVAAGFTVWKDMVPSTIIFLVGIPVASMLVVTQWAGLMQALGALSSYLNRLETQMRSELTNRDPCTPETLFRWEAEFPQRMRIQPEWWKPDGRWVGSAAIIVFGLTIIGGLTLGVYRGWDGHAVLVSCIAAVELLVYLPVSALLLRSLAAVRRHRVAEEQSGPTGVHL